MFEYFKNVHAPYEVVKTVGFDFDTPVENGQTMRFAMRVDVVRLMGEEDLAPVIWQVASNFGDSLLLHTAASATTIRGKTPEEVIAAVLKHLNRNTETAGSGVAD